MIEPGEGQTQRELEICMVVTRGNLARDLVVVPRYVPRTARSKSHCSTAVLGNLAKPPKAQTVTEHAQLLILTIFRQLSMLSSDLQLTAHNLFLQETTSFERPELALHRILHLQYKMWGNKIGGGGLSLWGLRYTI